MKRSCTKPARFLRVFLCGFFFFSTGAWAKGSETKSDSELLASSLGSLREIITSEGLQSSEAVLVSGGRVSAPPEGEGGHLRRVNPRVKEALDTVVELTWKLDPKLRDTPLEDLIDYVVFDKKPGPTGEKPEDEKPEKEEPEKKKAKADPFEGILRNLENQVRPPEQQQPDPRGARAREGEGDSSGGQPFFPQGPPPSSANDNNNSPNPSIDRLADRLGNLPQPNFNDFASSNSKKNEPEKPKFSLEPSKSSLDKDSSLGNPSSSSKKAKLPDLSSLNEGNSQESDSDIDFVGTPLQPKPSDPQGGSSAGVPAGGAGGNMGGGMMGGGMMGGMLGGGQAGFNSMGGDMDLSFPFDVTGEVPDQESDYEQWPRYRVVKIPMTGGSGGGLASSFSGSSGGAISDDSMGAAIKKGNNESFYFVNPAEASLKEVPGIFRSMASGFRKTRVQNLCENLPKVKIGLCQRRLK